MSTVQQAPSRLIHNNATKATASLMRSLAPLMLTLGLLLASGPANASAAVPHPPAVIEPDVSVIPWGPSAANPDVSVIPWAPSAVNPDASLIPWGHSYLEHDFILGTGFDPTIIPMGMQAAENKACNLREVEINIAPDDAQNLLHAGSDSLIPVALLSSPTLLVPAEVSPSTIRLAGARVRSVGRPNIPIGIEPPMHLSATNPFPCEARDVNGDGLDDLICHVQTSQMNLPMGVSMADLVVRTHDGDLLVGEDAVEVIELSSNSEIFLAVIPTD